MSLFRLALLCLSVRLARAALNVETHSSQDLVTKLRQAIFIETAYLEERPREAVCSSLDGPRCLASLMGESPALSLDSPGVVPDRLLHDLGIKGAADVTFETPAFDVLEAYRRHFESLTAAMELPPLAGADTEALMREARSQTGHGLLHFLGSVQESMRLPVSFSRGLPQGVTATWDGRWLVKDCGSHLLPSVPGSLALPTPEFNSELTDSSAAWGLQKGDGMHMEMQAGGAGEAVSLVVELTGSLGYLRFSRPVVLRSLFGRWQAPPSGPSALVGGRLGLQSVWVRHLDAKASHDNVAWVDLSGDSLQPVDEVVFIAMPGLEIAALEVVAGPLATLEDEKLALFLEPIASEDAEGTPLSAKRKQNFKLSLRTLSATAAPSVVSLQEVTERDLRLRGTPQSLSYFSGKSLSEAKEENMSLASAVEAASSKAMFQHSGLGALAALSGGPRPSALESRTASGLLALLEAPRERLPQDLQRELTLHHAEVVEAIWAWSSDKGWQHRTPTSLPLNGSDDAVHRYVTAKRWQTKLDLLTAAFIYMRRIPNFT